jgi:hypothetical protein
VCLGDRETSQLKRPWPSRGCSAVGRKGRELYFFDGFISITVSGVLLQVVRSYMKLPCLRAKTVHFYKPRLDIQEFSVLVLFVFPSSWVEERCGGSFFFHL